MAEITKTEEQLTKDLEVVVKKLYKVLEGTPEEKVQILRDKFESGIKQIQLTQETQRAPKKEKAEGKEEIKVIVELLKQLRPHAEIANQYFRTVVTIGQFAKKRGIASPKFVRQELKKSEVAERSNEELAEQWGVYPEAIERIRQEIEKTEESEEIKAFLELLKQLRPHAEIANQYDRIGTSISKLARERGIASPKFVRQELKKSEVAEKSNEELAEQWGVYPEAIERIRQEIEQRKQDGEAKRLREKQEKENRTIRRKESIIDLLKQLVLHEEIAAQHDRTRECISKLAREEGIASPKFVRQELKKSEVAERSNEELAEQWGVYPEAIERIRQEIEQRKQDREKKKVEGKVKKVRGPKVKTKERTEVPERYASKPKEQDKTPQVTTTLKKQIAPVNTYQYQKPEVMMTEEAQELSGKLGISPKEVELIKSKLKIYPTVSAIAKQCKVPRKTVEAILKIVQREEYDRSHTVVQYRIKMIDLRSSVKGEIKDSTSCSVLEHKVDILINEFSSFLTQNDYVFLAYGYAKARNYRKAIELGEEHLELDTPSISALEKRIQELLKKGLDDKGKQDVVGTFRILSEGNGDER